jgi:hypothetical protein
MVPGQDFGQAHEFEPLRGFAASQIFWFDALK